MDAKELRRMFRGYTAQSYDRTEPASLVSEAFPTCFTTSPGPHLVLNQQRGQIIQPCYHHWDKVGDGKHLSTFEMAATSDINQLRAEVCRIHYEFLTQELDLNPDYVKVEIFGGGECHGVTFSQDQEAKAIMMGLGLHRFAIHEGFVIERDYRGGDPQQINPCFVANHIEPFVGPKMKIRYDDVELWTSVLYNMKIKRREDSVTFDPIEEMVVCGFGLERALMVINGYDRIDDVFQSVRGMSPSLSYVVFDHVRGLVRLALDGAFELKDERKKLLDKYMEHLYAHLDEATLGRLEVMVYQTAAIYGEEVPQINGREKQLAEKIRARAEELKLKPGIPGKSIKRSMYL